MKGFASDNFSGIHPSVLDAIAKANVAHERAYGYDTVTAAAEELFRKEFGDGIAVHFVLTGTAANVLSIKTVTASYEAVICAEESHLNSDECGAPERHTCKLIPVPAHHGKLRPSDLEHCFEHNDEHRVRPRVISISQTTEWGTVYTAQEICELAAFAHSHGCLLHMDGARIANAAAALNSSLRQLTVDAGVDILSFGGTKNGLMCGEAVVFFDGKLAKDFKFVRKQGMQLSSKMRFISAQFLALLTNELWRKNAAHANAMAKLLADSIAANPRIKILEPVEANALFVQLPPAWIPPLRERFPFHVWKESESIARWMTSFDTTSDEIRDFAALIARLPLSP
jgi:threonine aldolase